MEENGERVGGLMKYRILFSQAITIDLLLSPEDDVNRDGLSSLANSRWLGHRTSPAAESDIRGWLSNPMRLHARRGALQPFAPPCKRHVAI